MSGSYQRDFDWLSRAFNLPVLQKSRMPWVDYLRGIAIVLVVYRHVLIGIERTGLHVPSILVIANEIFFSFRMPLFFILSGLFVSQSLSRIISYGRFCRLPCRLFYPGKRMLTEQSRIIRSFFTSHARSTNSGICRHCSTVL
jgi:uncharacterized membrane protein YcfT